MLPVDEKTLKAILSLEGNPDWEILKDWIFKSLGSKFIDFSHFQPSERLQFLSGASTELLEIEQTIKGARKKLEQISTIQRPPKIQ